MNKQAPVVHWDAATELHAARIVVTHVEVADRPALPRPRSACETGGSTVLPPAERPAQGEAHIQKVHANGAHGDDPARSRSYCEGGGSTVLPSPSSLSRTGRRNSMQPVWAVCRCVQACLWPRFRREGGSTVLPLPSRQVELVMGTVIAPPEMEGRRSHAGLRPRSQQGG